ncbi:MAG TPA: hypothetical protein EYO90_07155 [Candidatus Latescibacteria bacterium]|nr:hypothetical protein [Candidatus Latescibacterota bacterium]
MKPDVYGFPDQPAVNGVGSADHPDGAGRSDSYAQALAGIQSLLRQGAQDRKLIGKTRLPF